VDSHGIADGYIRISIVLIIELAFYASGQIGLGRRSTNMHSGLPGKSLLVALSPARPLSDQEGTFMWARLDTVCSELMQPQVLLHGESLLKVR
jgi:hypothetical protein